MDFVENEPHRNAISKVYISRSIERNIHSGDVIVFYRTGGYYKSVVTTIGVAEGVIDNIPTELSEQWNFNRRLRPFIVNFLYTYSFPKKVIMQKLIEMGVISGIGGAPRGFTPISTKNLRDILKECQADESIVVD